ncbi:MAG: glycine--tRNA ligase, partial [Candidatus Aenigmarchaeota archaeon]|nr:glycine--tRNA ligase [Candidatus Aenigmarchaeota archaeon]
EKAEEIAKKLEEAGLKVFYDDGGSIGRRYRRADEAGISMGITIDHQTLEDNTVTLRDRDLMKQVRVEAKNLEDAARKFLGGEDIEKLGKAI